MAYYLNKAVTQLTGLTRREIQELVTKLGMQVERRANDRSYKYTQAQLDELLKHSKLTASTAPKGEKLSEFVKSLTEMPTLPGSMRVVGDDTATKRLDVTVSIQFLGVVHKVQLNPLRLVKLLEFLDGNS